MSEMQQYPTTNTGVPANGEHGMAQTDMQVMQSLVADGGAAEFRDAHACGDATVSGQSDAQRAEVELHEEAKGTEVRYVRAPKAAVVGWPFMYSYRGNTAFINKATPKSKYQEACAAGVALF
jgi:hypothetical protein